MIGALQRGWLLAGARRHRAFVRALDDPGRAQRELLRTMLARERSTEFGRRHRLETVDGIDGYRRRVPLSTFDDYADDIARIRRGEANVLSRDPVTRLVPSSGSVGPRKSIPFTRTLQREFGRAITPWIVELYRSRPALLGGPAYWAVSPAGDPPRDAGVGPVEGYEDDSAYLGERLGRLVERTLAVPGAVRRIRDVDAWRDATLLYLLRCERLRLISVWHPSFLGLLLDGLESRWERLVDELATARPRLRTLGPHDTARIWPELRLVSCWADAHAAGPARALGRRLPGVEIQPKGLLATEAVVTIPFGGAHPLAVRSHLFEFLDEHDRAHVADELRDGESYRVVVSTGGGLYRYLTGDRVVVTGRLGATPCLRFVGRADRVSDLCGEKLSDEHVGRALRAALDERTTFAMLAPDGGAGYTLYVDRSPVGESLGRIDAALRENPHYDHARRLGQLAPPRLFVVDGDAHGAYLRERSRRGGRLGEVKPVALDGDDGWSDVFDGGYRSISDPRRRPAP